MLESSEQITRLLVQWSGGSRSALDQLLPLVYNDLKRLAGSYLRRERAGHTLQSTALVHEAFLRLVDQREANWQNRLQFFGIAAQVIRRILVDHARQRKAQKRGGEALRVTIDESIAVPGGSDLDLLALDDALQKLTALDERQSRIVELRFFSGLSIEETSEVLGLSTATVKREWSMARVWLFRELGAEGRA
ncbi:MAG TPA: sigma-70 family RNA polymerase sigma factor [Bryobacteraceae bacterium]|nr:sigma-70 family RNA polymerase sigma factor [Bryobacteraceae bacterium]